MKDKIELVRVLKTPEGEITLDITGKKNGRGAYICRKKDCLLAAEKSKGLERSFKMNLSTEIYEKLKEEFDAIEE